MDIEKETIGAEHCPFDVIIMAAVIEHLKDPAATLSVLNEYLTECGKIILTTPAPIGHLIIEPLSSLGILSHDASEEHKDLLSRGDIEIYAKKSGLQVTHYGKFLFGMNQIAILQKSKGDNLQILMPSNFTM
jgi:2-polyprenyl-3-methyl-5-hydroxy-6-metoxy-1,4-benzoquinol methylase